MNEKVLKKMGLGKNWIYETIVTTSDEKKDNAAPMGIWTKDFFSIEIEIYKNSKTFKNILATNELVVNFVDDPMIFYDSLYANDRLKYKKAKKVCAPVLREANTWLELKVKGKREWKKTIKISAEIVSHTLDKRIMLLNRAKYMTLESLIKATKVPVKTKEIEENLRVIRKVAPNSEYKKIVEKLLKR